METDVAGKQALVTGGTGFLGGRLIERLCRGRDAKVRVMVRDLGKVPRIGRFPVEVVVGDILEKSDVERAVEGCDLVFHCAYGNSGSRRLRWEVNVRGTRNVLEASSKAGTERVVHVSSMAVYGHPPDGDLDESAPRRYCDNDYADSKLQAERLIFAYAKKTGLQVAVIQPSVVYGPYAPSYTLRVLNQLKSGRVILVNGGTGLCNAVYVDDVVSALLLAARRDRAVGEAFLISAEEPVTWAAFFREFESMLGLHRTVSMTPAETRAYSASIAGQNSLPRQVVAIMREPQALNRLARSQEVGRLWELAGPWMKDLVRTAMGRLAKNTADSRAEHAVSEHLPIHPLDDWTIRRYESRFTVRIDKAKRLLGYRPGFSFERGMALTRDWARWANLLGTESVAE